MGINTHLLWWLPLSALYKCPRTNCMWNFPLWLCALKAEKLQIVSSLVFFLTHSSPLIPSVWVQGRGDYDIYRIYIWIFFLFIGQICNAPPTLTKICSAGRCDLPSLFSALMLADSAHSQHTTVPWKYTVGTKWIHHWWLKCMSTWACLYVLLVVVVVVVMTYLVCVPVSEITGSFTYSPPHGLLYGGQ